MDAILAGTIGTVILLALGVGRQARAWRFAQIEREFAAAWSQLPVAAKRRILGRAYATPAMASIDASRIDRLMFKALAKRRRAMREDGAWDFVKLREDLSALLT